MIRQSYHATMRIGGGAFSTLITANHNNASDCKQSAKQIAKSRLADSNTNPACIGCAEIVVFRDKRETACDNRIVSSFIVLK
jgi:hypothetical protein